MGAESAHPTRSSVKLFDLKRARPETALGASWLEFRRGDRARLGHGLELRGGQTFSWERSPLYVTSSSATALRIFDRRSYSLSILQNGGHAGLTLGPINLGAGFGVSLLNVDYLEHDFSFGMFWPKSLAAVGIRLGNIRIGAQAHVEYLWRWFGRDYVVRGLGITLDVDGPRVSHPMVERRD